MKKMEGSSDNSVLPFIFTPLSAPDSGQDENNLEFSGKSCHSSLTLTRENVQQSRIRNTM